MTINQIPVELNPEFIRLNGGCWYVKTKLPNIIINYLWEQIKIGKSKNIDARLSLVGNISESWKIEDPKNVLIDYTFTPLGSTPFGLDIYEVVSNSVKNLLYDGIDLFPTVSSLWVNFQRKYEFNPIHEHDGIYSFVIWMDIPYDHEEECSLPWVKGSKMEQVVGGFNFIYHDGNRIGCHVIPGDRSLNGTMLLFPSFLQHEVYPFYTSDEYRVSISGNIKFTQLADSD